MAMPKFPQNGSRRLQISWRIGVLNLFDSEGCACVLREEALLVPVNHPRAVLLLTTAVDAHFESRVLRYASVPEAWRLIGDNFVPRGEDELYTFCNSNSRTSRVTLTRVKTCTWRGWTTC